MLINKVSGEGDKHHEHGKFTIPFGNFWLAISISIKVIKMAIRELNEAEKEDCFGGIAWTTPALVALADSGSLGPLTAAFGLGYAIGTYAYEHHIRGLIFP